MQKLKNRGFSYWENSFKHKLTTMTSKAGPTKAQITPSASDSQQLQRKKTMFGFSVQTMCWNYISNNVARKFVHSKLRSSLQKGVLKNT